MMKIAIIDYGLGNLRSVFRGIEKAGACPVITHDPEEIQSADGIILPGVGAFSEGMGRLSPIRQCLLSVAGEVPLLGICLGMQMLMDESEEHGNHQGLSLIPGNVRKFQPEPEMKVPHMGWNTIHHAMPDDPLLFGIPDESYFYFVHSYYVSCPAAYRLCETGYIVPYASAVKRGLIYGVQFHPEKSGDVGLLLLKNFIGIC
ncbi:imidazole glycerol phosphate synthase subunit HisH [Methanocalculus taiwanensis]|uniref:Imidazole glycerol phosphate synthase subunit HisH n=1 Tax=Methanocalculus taiwanensis TaxID=106207 RepID=A0ABD4TFF7_9EURY|nr:imidazole glycerol phosphate synthase subunit HisH [Methanocalculus taiwanensis]MCQ1537717.1 imidazole glycerol phosphate synthase subunit HisH [Methanocalculus taiwanensis]